jgi:hypothetical protein
LLDLLDISTSHKDTRQLLLLLKYSNEFLDLMHLQISKQDIDLHRIGAVNPKFEDRLL